MLLEERTDFGEEKQLEAVKDIIKCQEMKTYVQND
jgi:hypothetical protein